MLTKIYFVATFILIILIGLVLAQPAVQDQLLLEIAQLEQLVEEQGFIPLMKEWVGILVWSG